jgi:deoxyribose-phosphate aldolase
LVFDPPDDSLFEAAETARRTLGLLDLTSLNEGDDDASTVALCRRAVTPAGKVAAVCLWPDFVAVAKRELKGSGVRVATVVNFPGGSLPLDRVLGQIAGALTDGADEIDIVMPYTSLLTGRPVGIEDYLGECRQACGSRKMKVILETGTLAKPALIDRAASLAIQAGADFLKTSTGKVPVGATPGAARVLMEAARAAQADGRAVGVKISGGVRDIAGAATYLALADRILGPKWASPETFRFGASGLLDVLLAELGLGPAGGTQQTY